MKLKKKDKNLLMGAAALGGAYWLYQKNKTPKVAGAPRSMVGAMLPTSSIVPASLRGQCSPVWLDAGIWGLAGVAIGYSVLAGKKLL